MTQPPAVTTKPVLSRRRLWAFRLGCVVIALTPFVGAEIYLRATRSVDSSDLARDPIFDTRGQHALFVQSSDGQRWQISDDRMEFFRPASFWATKSERQRRVFVLGGSTVAGRPFETETAFAKWLELRLQSADASHDYEVINCGGVSYASYRIAIVLQEVLSHSPDAIVLYTGHNEFLEERSYATIEGRPGDLGQLVGRSMLVQTISELMSSSSQTSTASGHQPLSVDLKTRLDLVDGMKRYIRDKDWADAVVEHYRSTLDRMIRMCRNADVPVVVCVPASDCVNTPPMKIMALELDGGSKQRFDSFWQVARSDQAGDQARIEACNSCLEIDPGHTGAHFVAGKLHWANQNTSQARFHLLAARDTDVCPLRATTPIIDAIEKVGSNHELELVRVDRLFDQSDSTRRPIPDGIPDPDRFVDHVHPTIAGHQEIAKELAGRLRVVFEIPETEVSEQDYQDAALKHLSTLDETYYARGEQRLKGLLNWAAGRAGKLSTP